MSVERYTPQDQGASAVADQALAVPVEPASSLAPSGFDPSRGTLGVDLIRWEIRAQYEWSEDMEEEYPDWDQCTTFWIDALTRQEAISKGWEQHFGDHVSPAIVRPVSVASCTPLHFVDRDSDRNPEGEDRNGLRASHESAGAKPIAQPAASPTPDSQDHP